MNKIEEINSLVSNKHLTEYYQKVFPLSTIVDFITQKQTISLNRRNLCFSFRYQDNTQSLHRYTEIASEDAFAKKLRSSPYRIDIGAVFAFPPNKKFIESIDYKTIKYEVKELVFDIDIKPFNWEYIKKASKDLNRVLKDVLGFKKLMFVFSGSKGVHCWVCDHNVLRYTAKDREDVVEMIFSMYPYLKNDQTLDTKPTTEIGHLIKLPFSVHPVTSKICVGFDIDQIDKIDIQKMPTITTESSEMKPWIDYFQRFTASLCK